MIKYFKKFLCLTVMAAIGIGTVAAQAIKREHKVENNGYEWVKLSIAGSEIVGAEDTKGSVLIPLSEEFSMISFVPHDEKGYFSVKKNNRNGAYSITGVELVPPAYDYLAYFGNEGFKYRVGDKWYSLGVYLPGNNVPQVQTQESMQNVANNNVAISNSQQNLYTLNNTELNSSTEQAKTQQSWGGAYYEFGLGFVTDDALSYNLNYVGLGFFLSNNIYATFAAGWTWVISEATEYLYGYTLTAKASTHFMPMQIGLGYRIKANESFSIDPFVGIDFNIGISSSLEYSYAGETEEIDLDAPGFGIGMKLGLRFNINHWVIFGKYNLPINDEQESITGDDGYLEIGTGYMF